MGTDIHFAMQIYHNGEWGEGCIPTTFDNWDKKLTDKLCQRHSDTFRILANVNNYKDRSGYIPPIKLPIGLPDDFAVDEWFRSDCHSFTWYTLKELIEHKWDDPIVLDDTEDYVNPLMSWEGYRPFISETFLKNVQILADCYADIPTEHIRLIIWFDS